MGIFSGLINFFKFDVKNKVGNLIKIENKHSQAQINFSIINNFDITSSVESAFKQINLNGQKTGQLVQKELKQNELPETVIKENLKDPEVLSAIANANKIACITKNETSREVLAKLIVQKLKVTEDEESIILTKAINVMQSITVNHVKLLALFYLYKKDYIRQWLENNELIEQMQKHRELLELVNMRCMRLGNTLDAESLVIHTGFHDNFGYKFPGNFDEYKILEEKTDALTELELVIGKIYKPILYANLTNKVCSDVGECIAEIYLEI